MNNMMNFKDKTIIITGASSGIGKETASLLSKLGAKMILIARNEGKLNDICLNLEGTGHIWYKYDLREIGGIEELIKTVVSENGKIDGCVYSAGISEMRPLKMTNYDFIHNMMLVNFYSFIELVRCLSRKNNYNENMSIVVMSSVAALMGHKGQVAYSATKAALDGAIRSISKEIAEKKMRINSINAGFVKTDMYKSYLCKTGKSENDPRFSNYILGLADPLDIANSIAFLLSNESRMITGTSMLVDSGYST